MYTYVRIGYLGWVILLQASRAHRSGTPDHGREYIYIYICMYIYDRCVYVYMYIYVYIYTYTRIYLFLYSCIYTSMYVCIYLFIQSCIYLFMRVYNPTQALTGINTVIYYSTTIFSYAGFDEVIQLCAYIHYISCSPLWACKHATMRSIGYHPFKLICFLNYSLIGHSSDDFRWVYEFCHHRCCMLSRWI
jgi:hypothetical protein